jgi:hypothetical protein
MGTRMGMGTGMGMCMNMGMNMGMGVGMGTGMGTRMGMGTGMGMGMGTGTCGAWAWAWARAWSVRVRVRRGDLGSVEAVVEVGRVRLDEGMAPRERAASLHLVRLHLGDLPSVVAQDDALEAGVVAAAPGPVRCWGWASGVGARVGVRASAGAGRHGACSGRPQ